MIIILMGVSGSGKTTVGQQLAIDLGWLYFDGDDFHSLKNIKKMSDGSALNDDDRSVWLTKISQHMNTLINSGQNAIFSCSALKQGYRRQLQFNSELIQFVYLQGSESLIKKRLMDRAGHFMKAELLASQFEALEEPDDAMIVGIDQPAKNISTEIQLYFGLSSE